jgi:hypothetical protein
MKLKDTVKLMNSEDYKERFKGEYFQLKIRIEGLRTMVKKYRNGELNFKTSCSVELLQGQLDSMYLYLVHLEERAKVENIYLKEE